jgi:phosphoribosyl-ATP pyrophosphohydrolase/phosphoribosyl-AMP cyclohydrolase/histidinol dehydrogenase
VAICNKLAPEQLEVMVGDANDIIGALKNYGSLFIGQGSAEVFGDYGAGPNHVLPTGGTARFAAGLSVFNFLRARTWLRVDQPNVLVDDAAAFARLEGLEAHARAAELRKEKMDED